jgi:hypothetical protein
MVMAVPEAGAAAPSRIGGPSTHAIEGADMTAEGSTLSVEGSTAAVEASHTTVDVSRGAVEGSNAIVEGPRASVEGTNTTNDEIVLVAASSDPASESMDARGGGRFIAGARHPT